MTMNIMAYLVMCLVVGLLGRHYAIGFVGFALIAFVFTPIIAIVILLLALDRYPPQRA